MKEMLIGLLLGWCSRAVKATARFVARTAWLWLRATPAQRCYTAMQLQVGLLQFALKLRLRGSPVGMKLFDVIRRFDAWAMPRLVSWRERVRAPSA